MQGIKNFKAGLRARTAILVVLDERVGTATAISKEASVSYSVVIHHLRLLEGEDTVIRKGARPYVWALTGRGQKRLIA